MTSIFEGQPPHNKAEIPIKTGRFTIEFEGQAEVVPGKPVRAVGAEKTPLLGVKKNKFTNL